MQNYLAYKKAAIRYWELRRILYNAMLVGPAIVGYRFVYQPNSTGDAQETHYWLLFLLFGLYVVGANVCYCFVYVSEFLWGSDDPRSRWLRYDRMLLLVMGILFAMFLALIGGYNIANTVSHLGVNRWD